MNYAPCRMLLTTAAGLWLVLACCGTAFAFSNYNGCKSCHGQYNVGDYQSLQDGTITIQWAGCNSAILTYDIPSAGQGMIPLQRVATDNVTLCETQQ